MTGTAADALSGAVKGAAAGMALGPVGAALGGAAGLLASLAPGLFGSLLGGNAERVVPLAAQAVSIISQVSGVDAQADPEGARAAIQGNSEASLQLQIRLAEISAELERQRIASEDARRAAELEEFKASLADTESARARDIALRASGGSNTRANVLAFIAFAGLILCLCTAIFLSMHTKDLDGQTGGLIIGIVVAIAGTFSAAIGAIYNFEFGSSRGSANKEGRLNDLAKAAVESGAARGGKP